MKINICEICLAKNQCNRNCTDTNLDYCLNQQCDCSDLILDDNALENNHIEKLINKAMHYP